MRVAALVLACVCGGCEAIADGPLLPAGTTGNDCDRPLPCAEGDPQARYARCERLDCTRVPSCEEGICVECWASTAYRHATERGSAWSDGTYAIACDGTGRARALVQVDADGAAVCAWWCEPGFCWVGQDGAELRLCPDPEPQLEGA